MFGPSHFFVVLWPLLTSHSSLLLREFFFSPPVRPPRVLTRSFTLIPALFTASDSVQLLGFGLCSSLTLAYGLTRFLFVGPGLCPWGTFQPSRSGFLQIPPRDGHPCLWLTLPAAGCVRDFHPIERALTGRTTSEKPLPVWHRERFSYVDLTPAR